MNLDALGRLVWEKRRPPRGLDAGQAAVTALPELCDGMPALIPGEVSWAIYSASADLLEGPVRAAFEHALREAEAPAGAGSSEGDELSDVLRGLIAAGLSVSPGAGVVPLLEVLRQTAALLSAPPGELSPRIAAIRAMPAEEQGAFLGRFASRIQVRVGVALARLSAAGVRVPALAQAIAGSRFAVLFERGALDLEASLPLLASVHGSGVPAATVSAGGTALRTAIAAVLDRRTANRSTPEDLGFLLRHVPPDLADRGAADVARALLTDPDALAWMLPQLARFTDAKTLTKAGVPAALSRDLLKPEQGLALAAALVEVLRELRRWDVISALAAAIAPVVDVDGRADRALVVPHGPVHAVVVAVALGRLRRPRPGFDVATQVERVWADAMRGVPGCIHVDLGFCALVVFLDALAAFRFALRIGQRFGGDPPAVGVGVGEISGGTDGDVVRLGGPAVESALQWLSLTALPPRAGMDGIHALGLHGGRLCGQGVGIDAAAADAIEGARHAAGLVGPRDAAPGGDARMPRSLDTLRVFEFDDEVVALARVSGVSGGFEAVRFSLPDWVALLDRDSASALPHPAPVAAVQRHSAPRPSAVERIEMPDLQAPAAQFDQPFTVIEPTPAPPSDPFAPEAAPRPDDAPLTAFNDPFAANAEPGRPLVLDVGVEDGFGPGRPQPVPEPAPQVRHDLLAGGGWGEDWSGAGGSDAESDLDAEIAASEAAQAAGDEAGDFTSFFLPGVEEGQGSSDPVVDVDIDDDPSVMSHSAVPAAFALLESPESGPVETPASAPARPTSIPPPTAQRPRGIKAERGGADGVGELPPRQRSRGTDAPVMDFEFLLRGYCAFIDGSQMVFGRPYGARIVDRHAYAFHGDADDAYRSFLQDKIGEGFAPRTELVGDLPRGVTLAPLEGERLTKAWRLLS